MRNPRILSIVFFFWILLFFFFVVVVSFVWFCEYFNLSLYIKLMCVFVTHAPSVNTNTESFYILYIPSSFVCRLSSSGKREKKDLMRWKITNNRCSHAQVKKKNGEDCRNDEKKTKKTNKQTKEEEKRNSLGVSREGRVFLEELWSSRIYLLTRRRRRKKKGQNIYIQRDSQDFFSILYRNVL